MLQRPKIWRTALHKQLCPSINGAGAACRGRMSRGVGRCTSAKQHQPAAPVDDSLTWHGITLYGIVDIGLQYTRTVRRSPTTFRRQFDIVQKFSRQSAVGATPSNLSQSRVGLQARSRSPMICRRVQARNLLQSPGRHAQRRSEVQVLNNGKASTSRLSISTPACGRGLPDRLRGISSKLYGTVTFGRQLTLLADGINKYDPNYGSQAFSLIGLSGPMRAAATRKTSVSTRR